MNKQALSLAVCIAGAYPLSSGAIGLGDIRSNSHLNQPLSAKIELLSTTVQEANQVQVRLASADVFNRVGIDRPAYLSSLRFTPTVQNGKPVILVSSNQAIKEPFLNFLLEVSWPKGQLLKEYTVLLDPPVLLQSGNTSAENTAAVRAEPKATGFVKRPEPIQRQQQTRNQQQVQVRDGVKPNFQAEPTAQPEPSSSRRSKSKYRVSSGDTLYKIATRVKPRGVSSDQMMVALFRANPDAFRQNNINRLKAGETLSIPSKSESRSASSTKAKQIIRKHYAEWKQYRKKLAGNTVPQKQAKAPKNTQKQTQTTSRANTKQPDGKAHLEVMGNKNNASSKVSSKVSAAGKVRITELEKQLSLAQEALVSKRRENADLKSRISDMESIIQKKDRLISLKSDQLAKLQKSLAAGNAKQAANTAPTQQPSTKPVNTDLSAHIANTANKDAGKINRTQTNDATPPVTKPVAPNTSQNNLNSATLAEKRREAAMAEATNKDDNTPESTGFKPEKENALLDLLSSPIVTAAGAGSVLLLLLGWLLLSRRKNRLSNDDGSHTASTKDDFDDDLTTLEDDISSNIGDAAEINSTADDDFFKDFGDDVNSIEIDNASITNETPDTTDVSTSLDTEDDDDILQEADVYIVYGLHEQAESELRKAINDNPNKLEYRHKLLENYLASNNKEAFDLQAAEISQIDGKNKTAIWEKVVEMGKKISPDNALYQVVDTSADSSSNTAGKIAAVGTAAVATVAAAAMASDDQDSENIETSPDNDDTDFDLDELLLDEGNQKPEEESTSNTPITTDTPENTTESIDFDELDDDFSDFGLDDDSFSLDDLEKELDDKSTNLIHTDDEDDDTEQDNVIDFESMLLEEEQDSSDDDLELANLNLNVDGSTGIDRILPKDTAYTAHNNSGAYEADEDDVLSFLDLPEEDIDLHEAHISTKLDLARAYLDMGDIEGARSTLEEVIVEGSDDQKREAEDLLHQTG